MATHQEKAECEQNVRKMLADNDLPEPDRIEYGCTCIWVVWDDPKVALRVDIDEDPDFDYDAALADSSSPEAGDGEPRAA